MRLLKKRVIITGAANGIGKAIALRFAREGAIICILDIDDLAAAKVVADIKKDSGTAYAIHCDVGYAKQVDPAFDHSMELMGGLDVLINNTGVIRQSLVVDMPEEDWDFIVQTNLKSVFLCTQRALKEMIRQNTGGRIIAMSSIHAVLSEPQCAHYTAAKGAIEAFMRTVASEAAPYKITANFIRPGATFTELTTPMYTEKVKQSLFERIPLREIATADYIAHAAVFLASDESSYMTGQDMTIDGGYTMNGSLPGANYWQD
ncbi:MAG: SDR family NAD(P)-dependent oxidoreductase [Sphingobacteriaceae bacterium]